MFKANALCAANQWNGSESSMGITFKQIINAGIGKDTPVSLEKSIRLCNMASLVVAAGLVPFVLAYGYHNLTVPCLNMCFLLIFNLTIPYLNHLGKDKLARTGLLSVNAGVAFVNSTLLGQDSLVSLYLVAGLPVSVIMFRSCEYILMLSSIGWSFLLIVLALIFCVTPFFEYELSPEALSHIRLLALVGALSCLLFFIVVVRKANDSALRNYNQLMINTQILKNDLDAVFFCDLEGRITFTNQAAEMLYGYSAEQLMGMELGVFNVNDSEAQVVERSMHNQHSWSGEIQQQRCNGDTFTALLTQFVVTDEHDLPIGVAATCKDITPHKQIERALIDAKDKAEEAAIAKANFVSTMSHEIRTPLNGVIGMTHLLLEDEPKPEHVESLNILKFAGENLLTLVNDVLDFSKIDARRITLETVPCHLSDLIRSIESSARYHAIEKGISFEVKLDERLDSVFQTDPVRLTQILFNLTSNAIKFTKVGGVTLSVGVIGEGVKNVNVVFTVSDTGIGIAPDKLDLIFEQFSQADSATTRHYGGSGLGLAITKGLLEAFGSSISVTSEPGGGSTFSFAIKMSKVVRGGNPLTNPVPPCEGVNNDASDENAFCGLSILIAEDNPVNIMVVRKLLTKWGVSLDIVNNGEEAVSSVQRKHYDLVLMDIQMPIMDGFQATLAIRSVMKNNNLPIIALTATATEEFKSEAFSVGMTDYLSKPFNPNHLKTKIRALCLNNAEQPMIDGATSQAI